MVQSTLPQNVRTPADEVLRLILKTAYLNEADPVLAPCPAEPKIGVRRVLAPYMGEMGLEVRSHLARIEPWLRNGWKIAARRPEFYPPGTAIAAPRFFAAAQGVMTEFGVTAAGGGLYVLPEKIGHYNIAPDAQGEQISALIELSTMERATREARAEIGLRRLFLEWFDHEGRPLTDHDREMFAISQSSTAETEYRLAESLRPSYRPAAFETPSHPLEPHVGFQVRAVTTMDKKRNSDPEWMGATALAIGAHLNLPVVAYGHPEGCVIPEGVVTTWRGTDEGHLARELGFLKSCRLMLSPDSGWADLMAWLGVPVLLEMLRMPYTFEGLRETFQPRMALADRNAPIGPQIDALLACDFCLPTAMDPRKVGTGKAMFPWEY